MAPLVYCPDHTGEPDPELSQKVEATFPRFSQQISGRARAEVSPDPELEDWAEQYCLNFLGVVGESDACGRWCSVTPKGALCTH